MDTLGTPQTRRRWGLVTLGLFAAAVVAPALLCGTARKADQVALGLRQLRLGLLSVPGALPLAEVHFRRAMRAAVFDNYPAFLVFVAECMRAGALAEASRPADPDVAAALARVAAGDLAGARRLVPALAPGAPAQRWTLLRRFLDDMAALDSHP